MGIYTKIWCAGVQSQNTFTKIVALSRATYRLTDCTQVFIMYTTFCAFANKTAICDIQASR